MGESGRYLQFMLCPLRRRSSSKRERDAWRNRAEGCTEGQSGGMYRRTERRDVRRTRAEGCTEGAREGPGRPEGPGAKSRGMSLAAGIVQQNVQNAGHFKETYKM